MTVLLIGDTFRYDPSGHGHEGTESICTAEAFAAQKSTAQKLEPLLYTLAAHFARVAVSVHTYRVIKAHGEYCSTRINAMLSDVSNGSRVDVTLYDRTKHNRQSIWIAAWATLSSQAPHGSSLLSIRPDEAFWHPDQLARRLYQIVKSGSRAVWFSFQWQPAAPLRHVEECRAFARLEVWAASRRTSTSLLPLINDAVLMLIPRLTDNIERHMRVAFPGHNSVDCLTSDSAIGHALDLRFLENVPSHSNPGVCMNPLYYFTDRNQSKEACKAATTREFEEGCAPHYALGPTLRTRRVGEAPEETYSFGHNRSDLDNDSDHSEVWRTRLREQLTRRADCSVVAPEFAHPDRQYQLRYHQLRVQFQQQQQHHEQHIRAILRSGAAAL